MADRWTMRKPTQPGSYWVRCKHCRPEPFVINLYLQGDRLVDNDGGSVEEYHGKWWRTPIKPPAPAPKEPR